MSYYADNPYDVYADYGVGRYVLLSEKFHRARKDHDCATCKSGIKAGTVYRAQFILEEGEALCPEVLRRLRGRGVRLLPRSRPR